MTEVTRSMEATGARSAALVAAERRAQPSGWWGMLILIASEACLLGCLIATYFYLRFSVDVWPPEGIEKPSVTLPLVFTAMLLASCVPVYLAVRAARQGWARRAWWLLLLAAATQATYLGLQLNLFFDDIHTFSPQDTAYGSVYFALLGIHHAHVAIGIAFDVWILARLLGGLTNYRLVAIRVIAIYWYFVAAIAVPVVLTQLYPSL